MPTLFSRAEPHNVIDIPASETALAQLAQLREQIRIVDVREPEEFSGALGHLPAAELVPLATLAQAAATWDRHHPVLLVCRSGARSAAAARHLVEQGFTRVFNLQGGMLAVRGGG